MYHTMLKGLKTLQKQLLSIAEENETINVIDKSLLEQQKAQLAKRIMVVQEVLKDDKDTSLGKTVMLNELLHNSKMQENLTTELEILTTIMSLQHTKSNALLKKNKKYLEEKQTGLQRSMNILMKAREATLRIEVKKLYKAKLERLGKKEKILREIRNLLQKRYLSKLPKDKVVEELMSEMSTQKSIQKALVVAKATVQKDEKLLASSNATEPVAQSESEENVNKDKIQKSETVYEQKRAATDAHVEAAIPAAAEANKAPDQDAASSPDTASQEEPKEDVGEHNKLENEQVNPLMGEDGVEEAKFEEDKLELEGRQVRQGAATPEMVTELHTQRARLREELKAAGRSTPGFLQPGAF